MICCAVFNAISGSKKSSQGFARETTEMEMEWSFMKFTFSVQEE